ncbi:MAG: hypothetical protein FJY20_05250 [Bacteroidetes bacterium]|nr:hypothetical protein [Bacteroidota bacterium]
MRYLITFLFIISASWLFGQTDSNKNCEPTTTVKAILCPDSVDCPCPSSARCATKLIASDKRLKIAGFKIQARGLENQKDEIEGYNDAENFAPFVLVIFSKLKEGSVLHFTCIKAINKKGQLVILQPLSLTFRAKYNN